MIEKLDCNFCNPIVRTSEDEVLTSLQGVTLFALEEAASWWSSALWWRTFFTTAVVAIVLRAAIQLCATKKCGLFGEGGLIMYDVGSSQDGHTHPHSPCPPNGKRVLDPSPSPDSQTHARQLSSPNPSPNPRSKPSSVPPNPTAEQRRTPTAGVRPSLHPATFLEPPLTTRPRCLQSTQQCFWSHVRPRHVRPRRLQSTQQRFWSPPTQPPIVRFKCIWSPSHLFRFGKMWQLSQLLVGLH
ncbi:uncharacterized protein LOC107475336 [Arachis duranensis]|uniref:Uncharacterized protein LOC107475336 n=1 Tax=Arachis duranensis TaxID=130453 RepID=A0A9C6WTD1_ARADU|nr:uncharacterized protein LOC107475336 [Arachis duranensis]